MSQEYKYTAADFERYHSGKMSDQEKHALEKAALKDGFLADALEGYVYTATPGKDISELRQKLFAKRKRKNVFFLISKQNAWTRIAAIFILVAGIGYLTYQLSLNEQNNTLAKKEDSSYIKGFKEQVAAKRDSLINEKDGFAIATPEVKGKEFMKGENKLRAPLQGPEDVREAEVVLQDQNLQNATVPRLQKVNKEMNILRGRLVDTLGNPLRYATIKAKGKKLATISDSTGRFMLISNDSSITAVVSAVGYQSKEKKLSDKEESVIVIEPANQSLNEVVVTASGITRSERALGYESVLKGKAAGIAVKDKVSTPLKELQAFKEYVEKSIRIPADGSGKNYKGAVILSFEINKKGKPIEIKIERSLCDLCDKEAVRLLMQGPKWKYSKDQRQLVTIEF